MSSSPLPHPHHPSSLRNRVPILLTLRTLLPSDATGTALEVASGTGSLLEVLAPGFPNVQFQPSEYVPAGSFSADEQWTKHGKIGQRSQSFTELQNIDNNLLPVFNNVKEAKALDLMIPDWPADVVDTKYDLMICTNTLHITPFACTENLMKNAGRHLSPTGNLAIYGPFKLGGAFVGDEDGGAGNEAFDQKLRDTNGEWGLRDVEELERFGVEGGLVLRETVKMPKNNFLLWFGRK